MLLNPSHTVTISGLSPDLLSAYNRYRRGTRAILYWLIQHGSAQYKNIQKLKIRELNALADSVCAKAPTFPKAVDFEFRETIGAREYLTKHFQRGKQHGLKVQETQMHEHFTVNLKDIYMNLCRCCCKPEPDCNIQKCHPRVSTGHRSLTNQFDAPHTQHSDQDEETKSPIDTELHFGPSAFTNDAPQASQKGPCLWDDDLCQAIQFMSIMDDLYSLKQTLIELWALAVRKGTSIMVSTCVTNAAAVMFREIEMRLRSIDDVLEPQVFRLRYDAFMKIKSRAKTERSPEWVVTRVVFGGAVTRNRYLIG